MSFNIGNNDRMPSMGRTGATGSGSNSNKNPLQEAVNPSNNRNAGGDMVLTPDHPSWNNPSSRGDGGNANPQRTPSGGILHDPSAPYTGGRATAGSSNTGPFRSGPDSDSYLPQGAVPQGARFDPIMPDEVRQGLPQRGQPSRGLGQSHGSGEPDFDELLPPQ
ncbi:hypothetical protein EDD11_002001 [Mortierella claussenii]|nr:hypothetical protein EDD11_002001 [Mortierella claussenii]